MDVYKDITGMTFGKWTVLHRTDQKKVVRYVCRCVCGTTREVLSASLRSGKSVSCGCYLPEKWSNLIRRKQRPTYISWMGMKQRCSYAGHNEYHRYGGRGITYDKRWKSFECFLDDMGPKPTGTSLDRIDNNGPYCKENCCWSTREEQSSNTCRNIVVTYEGQTTTLKKLSKYLGLNYERLHNLHRDRNLPIDEAVRRASAPTRG